MPGAGRAVGEAARVTVLAVGKRGWGSLHRCSRWHPQIAWQHGCPEVPRRRRRHGLIAERHAAGLVLLLGPASDVGQAVAARRLDLARAALDRWRDLGVEVAIEVVDHLDAPGSTHRAARMAQLARQANVPAVLPTPSATWPQTTAPSPRSSTPPGTWSRLARRRSAASRTTAALSSPARRTCPPSPSASRNPSPLGPHAATRDRRLALRCRLDPAADLGIGSHHLPEASTLYRACTARRSRSCAAAADALAARRYQSRDQAAQVPAGRGERPGSGSIMSWTSSPGPGRPPTSSRSRRSPTASRHAASAAPSGLGRRELRQSPARHLRDRPARA